MSDIVLNLFSQISLLEVVLIILSIAGQELITKRNKNGFFYWMAANMCGILMFYADGRGLMVLLYAYYFLKCVQGMRHWRLMDVVERNHMLEITTLKSRITELENPIYPAVEEIDPSIESSNVLRKIVSDLAYVQLLSSAKKYDESLVSNNNLYVKDKSFESSDASRIVQC